MIEKISADSVTILQNTLKRKKEDDKLFFARKQAQNYREQIDMLKQSIEQKNRELERRKQQLQNHKKFTEFLESAVESQREENGETSTDGGIDALRARFLNLKNENKSLREKKQTIQDEMELVRAKEREELTGMTRVLYERGKEVQKLQREIEDIQESNSFMEQEFENEINKKNNSSKEVGQIVHSINNVFSLCERIKEEQGVAKGFHNKTRLLSLPDDIEKEAKIKDNSLAENMIQKLESCIDMITDLLEVDR